MIEYIIYTDTLCGELYIEHNTSRADTISTTGYYSFDPAETGFNEIGDYKINILSDLLSFLNFDETTINKIVDQIASDFYAYFLRPVSCDNDSISNSIESAKSAISSISSFFARYEDYYLFDLVMLRLISKIYEENAENKTEKEDAENIILSEEQRKNSFSKIHSLLAKKILKDSPFTSLIMEDLLEYHYNAYLNYPDKGHGPNFYDKIISIKNFIVENIPPKKYSKADPEWQKFMYTLSRTYGAPYHVNSYSLTNHAKCKEASKYKLLLSSLQYPCSDPVREFLMGKTDIFKNCASPKATPFSANPEINHDLAKLFEDSSKQSQHTYLIRSFNDYIIAELYSLCDKKLVIKQCKACMQYIISGNKLAEKSPHICLAETNPENVKNIVQLFKKKIAAIDNYYNANFNGPFAKKEDLDYNLCHNKFEELKNHHKKMCQEAILTQKPYQEYEAFINQDRLCPQIIEKALEYKKEMKVTQSDYDWKQSLIEDTIYYERIRFPNLDEIITPEDEEKAIEKIKRIKFADIEPEEIISNMEKGLYDSDQGIAINEDPMDSF